MYRGETYHTTHTGPCHVVRSIYKMLTWDTLIGRWSERPVRIQLTPGRSGGQGRPVCQRASVPSPKSPGCSPSLLSLSLFFILGSGLWTGRGVRDPRVDGWLSPAARRIRAAGRGIVEESDSRPMADCHAAPSGGWCLLDRT